MHARTCSPRRAASRRGGQRGVVAIIVGLSIAVMVGFIGLALDGGRLYLTKTELQNGADACALAASYELTGAPAIEDAAFPRAVSAGTLVATRNRVGFQGSAIDPGSVTIEFSESLTGSWSATGTANAQYARCTIERTGITPWFMQVLGFGDAIVRSAATATLAPAQTNCAIPMGVCMPGGTPPSPGQWLTGHFGASNGETGSFNWLDYSPTAGNEVADLLRGSGTCSISSPTVVHAETGNIGANAARAWNSRFGVYHRSQPYGPQATPSDFTGYGYTAANWPSRANALGDFMSRRAARDPYQGVPNIGNSYDIATREQLQQYGADRRLVVVPIIDCSGWGPSHQTSVQHWACVLLLHPIASETADVTIEYVGRADEAGSPCATTGIAGDASSLGPLVPALVQ